MVPNELNRCALGDRSELIYAPAGSLTLYLQKENPANDKEANWLPAPDGPFALVLCIYWTEQAVLDGS